MKLKQILSVTLALVLVMSFASMAIASTNQSNQDLNRAGVLIAPEPDFKINVYPSPSTKKRRLGYGQGGDHVTVIQQVGSNEGYTWDFVKFEKSPQIEGWVRSNYISVDNPDNLQPNKSKKNQGQNNYQSNQSIGKYRNQ